MKIKYEYELKDLEPNKTFIHTNRIYTLIACNLGDCRGRVLNLLSDEGWVNNTVWKTQEEMCDYLTENKFAPNNY